MAHWRLNLGGALITRTTVVHTSNLPLPLKTVTVFTHNLCRTYMPHITCLTRFFSNDRRAFLRVTTFGDLMGRFCTCCSVREEMLPTVVMLRARPSCTRPWVLWRVWRCEDSVGGSYMLITRLSEHGEDFSSMKESAAD